MISSCRPSPFIYQLWRQELRHTCAETLVITLRFYVWRSGADDVDARHPRHFVALQQGQFPNGVTLRPRVPSSDVSPSLPTLSTLSADHDAC